MPASNMPVHAPQARFRQQRQMRLRSGLAAVVPALVAVACVAAAFIALPQPAPAGRHMLLHVLTMSALAPLIVLGLRAVFGVTWRAGVLQLWLATFVQLSVFLYWHSPAGMTHAMHAAWGAWQLQASLLMAAGWFWWCVAGIGAERTWHAIAALLVTGKLFCLVAVILTFAPRTLYHMMTLADQQLAGLIMITLCPLTYIASALWLCRRWLLRFDAREPAAT